MWDLIVSVPDHCLSFYFSVTLLCRGNLYCWFLSFNVRELSFCKVKCKHAIRNLNEDVQDKPFETLVRFHKTVLKKQSPLKTLKFVFS